MKIKLKILNSKPYLVLKYEQNEWCEIERILLNLGLKKAVTKNGFGNGSILEFYKEENTELKNYIDNSLCASSNSDFDLDLSSRLIDDINKPLFLDNKLNIAFFRVIPNPNNEVWIKLDKFLTLYDLRNLIESIAKVIERLLNITVNEEFELKINEIKLKKV